MKKPKQGNNLKPQKSSTRDWFSYAFDDEKQLVIPLGPRFQANVPEWTGPPQRRYPHKTLNNLDSSKWSGTVTWSNKNRSPEAENDVIGRGRPHRCDCYNPGSILCVKSHINEKTAGLQKDLGPVFQIWKFNEMGEVLAKLWKQSEQQKFARIVKTNPNPEGKNFIKIALESFPSKAPYSIVGYYFNVYLLRRISIQTRSGCTLLDTDNEEEDKTIPCSKGSQKRPQVDGEGPASKIMKVGYLMGRR